LLVQTSEDKLILFTIPQKILNISILAIHEKISEKQNENFLPQTIENEKKKTFEDLDINPIFEYKNQFEFEFMNL